MPLPGRFQFCAVHRDIPAAVVELASFFMQAVWTLYFVVGFLPFFVEKEMKVIS
jgi:hypothetical protein